MPHNGLDASSSALSLLSAELPYPSSAAVRGVISDKVSYSFINGLHECKGRETYLALHAFWREVVPGRLGQRWKYERVKTWQPSPSTVIVRWKVSWLDGARRRSLGRAAAAAGAAGGRLAGAAASGEALPGRQ